VAAPSRRGRAAPARGRVFKTCAVWEPHARSVRLRRPSVRGIARLQGSEHCTGKFLLSLGADGDIGKAEGRTVSSGKGTTPEGWVFNSFKVTATLTGDRRTKDVHRGIDYDHLHRVVDEHRRIAYVELYPREDADTNARPLERALRFFAELGLDPPEAVMMTTTPSCQAVLSNAGIRQIRIPPYTPRWNGNAERFIRTLQHEWAYAHSWPDSHARARSLPSFVRYHNRQRPHSSLGDRPPISRVHNLRGQYN
jgi:transposase InsO family protein